LLHVAAAEEGATALKGADLSLLDEIRRIATRVEALREESYERPPLAVRVPDDLRNVADETRAASVLPPARLAARGRAWEDLGFGGVETPARLLRLLAGDLAGIGFDPSGNRLLVSPSLFPIEDFVPETEAERARSDLLALTGVRADEPVAAHVLLHVRQRERSGKDLLEPTTDALLASAAWAEGEANLVALLYLFGGMDLTGIVVDHDLDPAEVLGGRLLPAGFAHTSGIERRLLDFVYREGFARAVAAFRGGGWSGLAEAMARDRSTRGVLHPGAPEPARFPPPGPPPLEGLTLADEDSLGELAIVVLVSHRTGKDNLGLVAGDGWSGDRVLRWEDARGDGITEWQTRWTSTHAAEDFSYAIGRTLAARFPEATVERPAPGRLVLASGGRVHALEHSGTTVVLRSDPARTPAAGD
jgi:hypothetical protein